MRHRCLFPISLEFKREIWFIKQVKLLELKATIFLLVAALSRDSGHVIEWDAPAGAVGRVDVLKRQVLGACIVQKIFAYSTIKTEVLLLCYLLSHVYAAENIKDV